MSKYTDATSTMQVIGSIFLNPKILDMEEKYTFPIEGFDNEFHKVLYQTIYNLHKLGAEKITVNTIEDYLKQYPKKYGIYQSNNGSKYLEKLTGLVEPDNFDFYYDRMRKMTLLRMYSELGLDLTDLYDPDNILNTSKKQVQEEWLNESSLTQIAEEVEKRVEHIKLKYADEYDVDGLTLIGNDVNDVLQDIKESPSFGVPMYGDMINSIYRGARLQKVYMRSSVTGLGKTRSMIADACMFACNKLYDPRTHRWVSNGAKEPTMFITTEQEKKEIITMCLAFVSAVNEEHILTGFYDEGELERVQEAASILNKTPLYIKELPDFSMEDIENTIKFGITEYKVRYVAFDYIHTSVSILSEVAGKAGVKGLREDSILFLIGVKLKDIANKYGVFILTATQLNGGVNEAKVFDQNLLRGAKSLADKIDGGMIMLRTTEEDIEKLKPILEKTGYPTPDTKISIYKNRSGKYTHCLLWCVSDRGICRIDPIFATTYQYEYLDIPKTKINVRPDVSAF